MDCTTPTILVVEDHRATLAFLADNLTADGFEVLPARTAAEARRALASGYPDLAILDLGLPDQDGLELVSLVRDSDRFAAPIDPDLPLLILSGRASEVDRLRGFDRGCDDFLVKPFSYPELRARVSALLRRSAHRPGAVRLRVGPLELDAISRQVWLDGVAIRLSRKEFGLLRALATEPTRVFTREELLTTVWGFKTLGSTRTLDSHAARLRRKLNAAGASFIVNVWGVGYRLMDGTVE
jgi:DNA-binding response OmpR family regulator